MLLNRKAFYAEAKIPLFGGVLTQRNVDGVEPLLDVWESKYPEQPIEFLACILAQVFRETGGRMTPQRETYADSTKQAVARLENAWANGKMPWVKTPYWRDGGGNWIGRGRIQNTHKANYEKIAKRFNRPDVLTNPDVLLTDDKLDAEVTVVGFFEGLWTGKELSDFMHGGKFDAFNARQIVNGYDHAQEIAHNYELFLNALRAAQAKSIPVLKPESKTSPAEDASDAIDMSKPPVADGTSVAGSKINWSAVGAWLSANVAALLGFFQSVDWKIMAILMAASFGCLVMVVIFRRRLAYLFGA